MSDDAIKYTIKFNDPELDDEEKDEEAQKLLNQMRDLDEVTAKRVVDPDPPEGNKALGGFLVGMLTAEVNAASAKQALGFLKDRLGGKSIELEVEGNGKRLKVTASSRAELETAIQQAQAFISA
ncbi:MAG: hypothetical protein F6J97_15220 [Leptolyngbya sp. SIO4C1]|nr:hypothetical protein [Leptolyngbya sp. SIO4C1]